MATDKTGKASKVVVNVPSELKSQAMALYERMGMSLSTAVNVFLAQSVRDGGMPFMPKVDEGLAPLRRRRLNPKSKGIIRPEIHDGAILLDSSEYDPDEDAYDERA